jgi:hypothetical protein
MFNWQHLRYHLLFDAALILLCLLSIVGVWNHYEGEKIYDALSRFYFYAVLLILVHQVVNLFSGDRKLIIASAFLFFLYLVLGLVGFVPFIERSFAW